MPKSIKKVITGGGFDKSIKPYTEKQIINYPNGEHILNEFKHLISEYRFWRKGRDTTPNKSTSIKHLERISKQITELKNNLDLIPPEVIAIMEHKCNQIYKELFFMIQQRLNNDLYKTQSVINHTLSIADRETQKKGERPKKLEHILLSDVAQLLEKKANLLVTKAAGVAAELLRSNGVQNMPSTPSDARKEVRKIIQGKDRT